MIRVLIISLLSVLTMLLASATPIQLNNSQGIGQQQLTHADTFEAINHNLTPEQIIQLPPQQWQPTGSHLFKVRLPASQLSYSQRWLKFQIHNDSHDVSYYRLVLPQPILTQTNVYVAGQGDVKAVTESASDNVEGATSFPLAIEAMTKKNVYVQTQFGLSLPQISLWQENDYLLQKRTLATYYWLSIGSISILMLLTILLTPLRLINRFFIALNILLIMLWATLNGQWFNPAPALWLTKTILSGLLVCAALARYQRFTKRPIAIKRLIVALIVAAGLWLLPQSYNLLIYIALPLALIILMLNSLEPPAGEQASRANKYAKWEVICFNLVSLLSLVVVCLALAQVAGFISEVLSLNQALQIVVTSNLIMLILSSVLRLKFDLSQINTNQQFTTNLKHQIVQQQATISQLNSDLKMASDRLKIDEVTGLRNYDYFSDTLGLEINRTRRHNFPISILMIKLNGLDRIAQQYDYQTVNKCLQSLAIRCQSQIKRSSDKICRYQDDLFALILPDTHSQGAFQLSQKLLNTINDSQLTIDKNQLSINASIGLVTAVSNSDITATKLIEALETAVNRAIRSDGVKVSHLIVEQ